METLKAFIITAAQEHHPGCEAGVNHVREHVPVELLIGKSKYRFHLLDNESWLSVVGLEPHRIIMDGPIPMDQGKYDFNFIEGLIKHIRLF